VEPLEYLKVAQRRWWVIAAAFVVAIAAVLITTPSRPKAVVTSVHVSYRATHVLLQQATASSRAPANLSVIAFYATTGEVPRMVAAKIGYAGDPTALAGRVTVTTDTAVGALKVTASDPDAERAALLANTFATELLQFLNNTGAAEYQTAVSAALQRSTDLQAKVRGLDVQLAARQDSETLRAERDAAVRQYSAAYERYQQLLSDGPAKASLQTVQEATPIPVSSGGDASSSLRAPTSRKARLPILGGLGLLLGFGAALVLDRLDTRLRTKADVEAAFGLPVLAEIPAMPRSRRRPNDVVSRAQPASRVAEAYRILRTALLLVPTAPRRGARRDAGGRTRAQVDDAGVLPTEGAPQVILLTSASPSEGKTTSVANLAASFAEAGRTVIVLSCDFRRPQIQKYLEIEGGLGLSDVLAGGEGAPKLLDVLRETAIPNVWLVPSGSPTPNPAELLARGQMIFDEVCEIADIVLVDSGPLLSMSDASELVPFADAVLVLARAGRTRVDTAARTAELLSRLAAPTVGVALVAARDIPRPARRYYYHYKPVSTRRARLQRLTPKRGRQSGAARARTLPAAVDRDDTADAL
jgi:capsular exopolysaccharide synthesis family protein